MSDYRFISLDPNIKMNPTILTPENVCHAIRTLCQDVYRAVVVEMPNSATSVKLTNTFTQNNAYLRLLCNLDQLHSLNQDLTPGVEKIKKNYQ